MKNSESTADLYARLTDDEKANLSAEDRAKIHRLIDIEARTSRYIRNTMATVCFVFLAWLILYTGGGNGYGRYSADMHIMFEND